jgi:hypothetical protein
MFVIQFLSFLACLMFPVVIDQTSCCLMIFEKLQDNKGENFEQ